MKKWVFLVVWALAPGWLISAPASAQTASFATQFYGTWYPYPLGNPSTGSTRYEFRHNPATGKDEITLTRTCPGEYRTAVAKVSTAVEISENSIHVLKGRFRHSDRRRRCHVPHQHRRRCNGLHPGREW